MSRRDFHIDAMKVVASNLIVLHHFTAYGPLAEALELQAPALADWLFGYARMGVQVFLVIGGYFAARALSPFGQTQLPKRSHNPLVLVAQRYWRLVPPFAIALVIVAACSALARPWLDGDMLPDPPTVAQFVAHLTLLSGVLGVESLSVGVWYVAIDFQLFTMMVLLLWLGRARARWVVAGVAAASLWVFNLQANGDNWAPYFFGAYGMGAMAWWAGNSRYGGRWLAALVLVCVVALAWDFRTRIALAFMTALLLGWMRWQAASRARKVSPMDRFARLTQVLGRSAYALFLTHFAVLIWANALWESAEESVPGGALGLTLAAWVGCVALSLVFERWVERPVSGLRWTGFRKRRVPAVLSAPLSDSV